MTRKANRREATHSTVTIEWRNPNTDPPDGWPRYLWGASLPRATAEAEAKAVYDALGLKPGCGYTRTVTPDVNAVVRRWPKETKARVRRNRLWKRLHAKFPLFAQELYDAELARRPRYFEGENYRPGMEEPPR